MKHFWPKLDKIVLSTQPRKQAYSKLMNRAFMFK